MLRFTLPLLAVTLLASTVTAAEKPNVLFIVADDLRGDLGCYGSPALSPNLDKLAKRGVLFKRAYCQQALCNPSRSSFLTSRRPDTLHLWANGFHFRDKNPDVVTLPQWFKENGYITRNVGKIFHNWHTKEKGDPRSWSADEFLHYATHGDDKPAIKGPLPPNLAKAPRCEMMDVPDGAYYDGRVAEEAIRVLGEIKDKPFFLAVGMWKPHAPFNAPKKYWDRYDRLKIPALDPARPKGAPELAFHDGRELRGLPPKQFDFTADEIREIRHGYFANINYMDEQVGKVLAALDSQKLTDNTIIVFHADHGYHLGEHGLWAKTSCFEWDARVPLIICPPKSASAGKTSEALVELIDLFPTLNELCGLPAAPKLEGTSLVPVLNDPTKTVKRAAFTQHPRPAYYDRTEKKVPDAMGYSIRTDKVRYTEWRDWESGKLLGAELYDHTRDPLELTNAIDAPPDANALAEAKKLLHKAVPPEVPPSKR
ncbi:MAG: sulfatase [Planctomycetia bacterium]|nr:sulfatase [Planctomycetia bacterium]